MIAAHNTLNRLESGPFARINEMEEVDLFFIRKRNGSMLTFSVYANEKIASDDMNTFRQIALQFESSITLLTCEDEIPEGGYAARRVIAAREINQVSVD